MWHVLIFSCGVLGGGLAQTAPWLVAPRERMANTFERLKTPIPLLPEQEGRFTRWFWRAGLTGAVALGVALWLIATPAPLGWKLGLGLVVGMTGSILGVLLVEALRHLVGGQPPRAAAALRHVGLADYVPRWFLVGSVGVPLLTLGYEALSGAPLGALVVPLLLTALTAGLAVWFVRQPECVDSLPALLWRDATRSQLLSGLLVLPTQFVYLGMGMWPHPPWGSPQMFTALVATVIVGLSRGWPAVQRRFLRRLWPGWPSEPVPSAPVDGQAAR